MKNKILKEIDLKDKPIINKIYWIGTGPKITITISKEKDKG